VSRPPSKPPTRAPSSKRPARPGKAKPNAKRRQSPDAPPPVSPKRRAGGERKAAPPRAPEAAPPALPSLIEIKRFLDAAPGRVGRNEIARHFRLTGDARNGLRGLLRQLDDGGGVTARRHGSPPPGSASRERRNLPEDEPATTDEKHPIRPLTGRLPETVLIEIFGTDPDGEPLARPVGWRGDGPPPLVMMRPERPGQPALTVGDRVLARTRPIGRDRYEGRTFKRVGRAEGAAPARILGVYEEGRIIPTDRRQKADWAVPPGEDGGAKPGEIVLAEPLPTQRPLGLRPARIVERLGRMGEPRSVSLVCIHAHGIPDVFPAEAVAEAGKARGVTLRGREDLTALPLVTIDGDDARDFDDAVWAAADGSNWRIIVAIADVAHYVRPGSALDREAWARGNSVYFPDRVVPMLPEALSNGWCSLKPNEKRGCLFVEMRFDAGGTKISHRFGRGLMRSAARLTYEQAQAAADAGTDPDGVPPGHVALLYAAFRALLAARERRGTLELDLPERRVLLDPRGRVSAIVPRARLDSHRLIEEFMVAANVCAAEELERLRQPCMYRIHDRPSDLKLETLRAFLHTLNLSLPPSNNLHPRNFAGILEAVKGRPDERLVNETVLRSQSQAAYAPDNIGHFGLALPRYAHFTSPIRRYADLCVHRALIRGLKLGVGALEDIEAARFVETAEQITRTERRAATAERDAVDRYLAAFMADQVGEVFAARISGVTRFGLFVTVEANGASGIVPLGSLPDDRWIEDQSSQALVGQRTRLRFALGQGVSARLVQATPRTGGMVFQLDGIARGRGAGASRKRR